MQQSAPAALDLSQETVATRKLYGLDQKPTEAFGRNCLIARRLLERGVRFVQVWSGAAGRDGQLGQPRQHSRPAAAMALATDQPCRRTGQGSQGARAVGRHADRLDTEFGRMPFSQGQPAATTTPAPSSPGWPGRESREASPMARATNGPGNRRSRLGATICTPRSCTCWASTTPGSRSASTAPIAA